MASRHDRSVASFPAWARRVLTNGGTVVGGNGATYKYDPLSGKAVVVKWPSGPAKPAPAPAAPTASAPQPTREPDTRKGLPSPGERVDNGPRTIDTPSPQAPRQSPPVAPVDGGGGGGEHPAGPGPEQPADPVDPNDRDGNGVPDYIDAQKETARRNAFELLRQQFRAYGIIDDSFFQYIHDLLVQGYDASTISMMLQEHKVYKERFKGNEARRGRGLGVLSPAEYLATEAAYAQVLRSLGLPPGFYDDPKSDFADWIGKDVSPQEILQRGELAVEKVNQTDPTARQALREFYGVTDSQLAAYFLDDKRALPILQKQAAAADIGGAALRVGLATSRGRAEQFVDQGVTKGEASQAYGQIAGLLDPQKTLAQRHFESYGQADAEDELLGGLASARRKRERINRKEEALFEGAGAAGPLSFRRQTSSSY